IMAVGAIGNLAAQKGKISQSERAFIQNYLKITQEELVETLAKVGDDIWNKRPADGGWTVAECMEHIITAEGAIFMQLTKSLEAEANNELSTKAQDGWLLAKIADRGVKVNTPLPPAGNGKSKSEMLAEFESSRSNIAEFLEDKSLQLRNHFGRSPYGPADAYQLLIVIAGHSMRHTSQIVEILSELES
ncbi:MAG: DinB family protein, partial [Cyclobacteriaceae bacterium]|nr:DinB family protein [Cyclobacteriaceae bacterium HetDA_MAG_MS6]